jgi:hypothetical protein
MQSIRRGTCIPSFPKANRSSSKKSITCRANSRGRITHNHPHFIFIPPHTPLLGGSIALLSPTFHRIPLSNSQPAPSRMAIMPPTEGPWVIIPKMFTGIQCRKPRALRSIQPNLLLMGCTQIHIIHIARPIHQGLHHRELPLVWLRQTISLGPIRAKAA